MGIDEYRSSYMKSLTSIHFGGPICRQIACSGMVLPAAQASCDFTSRSLADKARVSKMLF